MKLLQSFCLLVLIVFFDFSCSKRIFVVYLNSKNSSYRRFFMSNTISRSDRQELHRKIWAIAEDLRNSVDAWDFKQYVLTMLFYRFISEQMIVQANKYIRTNMHIDDLDYRDVPDDTAEGLRDIFVPLIGYYIKPSALFEKVLEYDEDNFNEKLNSVFSGIEASTVDNVDSANDFKGLFADFDTSSTRLGNLPKERNAHLRKIMTRIAEIDFGDDIETQIDLFGDAYEYLMRMYAGQAGKSGGEFFTPPEVSALVAKLAFCGRSSVNKVYDPCCGSGGLLLQALKQDVHVEDVYAGQDINPTTYNLCRMNMFLHGLPPHKFNIELGDTLCEPQNKQYKPFDAIVSNPPYSVKWVGKDNPTLITDERFADAGVLAPKSKADWAFLEHMLYWLSDEGCAAVVVFPGILYRGGAEGKIRKYFVDKNVVDAVIQLPPNMFFGTSIQTCIFVMKKNRGTDTDVLFVNAEEMFGHVGNKNVLRDEDIEKIYKIVDERVDVDHVARLVKQDEIIENDYVLSVTTYVQKDDAIERRPLSEIQADLDKVVAHEAELRAKVDAIMGAVLSEK